MVAIIIILIEALIIAIMFFILRYMRNKDEELKKKFAFELQEMKIKTEKQKQDIKINETKIEDIKNAPVKTDDLGASLDGLRL